MRVVEIDSEVEVEQHLIGSGCLFQILPISILTFHLLEHILYLLIVADKYSDKSILIFKDHPFSISTLKFMLSIKINVNLLLQF